MDPEDLTFDIHLRCLMASIIVAGQYASKDGVDEGLAVAHADTILRLCMSTAEESKGGDATD